MILIRWTDCIYMWLSLIDTRLSWEWDLCEIKIHKMLVSIQWSVPHCKLLMHFIAKCSQSSPLCCSRCLIRILWCPHVSCSGSVFHTPDYRLCLVFWHLLPQRLEWHRATRPSCKWASRLPRLLNNNRIWEKPPNCVRHEWLRSSANCWDNTLQGWKQKGSFAACKQITGWVQTSHKTAENELI